MTTEDESYWTDTHCHLQDEFVREPDGRVLMLERARDAAVRRIVCIGTGLEASREAVALARAERERGGAVQLWSSIGLHPHEADEGTAGIAALLAESVATNGTPGAPGSVVAVGECGLDYFYDNSPRDLQRQAFIEQVELAHRFGLTLVVHTRDAWDDTVAILTDTARPTRVIIHCFTGGPTEAERLLAIGCYLSFSGIVTFKNAEATREAARRCPADRLLVETDAPFLAPVPHRGRPNEPAFVSLVGAAVAELRAESAADLAAQTSANAARAFGLVG